MGKGLGPFRPLTRVGYFVRRRFSARGAAAIRFPPESDRAHSSVPRPNRQGPDAVALLHVAFRRFCRGYVNLFQRSETASGTNSQTLFQRDGTHPQPVRIVGSTTSVQPLFGEK